MSKILIADNELALAAKLESFLLEKGYDVVGIHGKFVLRGITLGALNFWSS